MALENATCHVLGLFTLKSLGSVLNIIIRWDCGGKEACKKKEEESKKVAEKRAYRHEFDSNPRSLLLLDPPTSD